MIRSNAMRAILEWVEKEKIKDLNLWEGDKIFFRLMDEEEEFFSLKLVYNKSDVLRVCGTQRKADGTF